MREIQYGLIHQWLTSGSEELINKFNNQTLSYLKNLKQTYDNYCFKEGQKRSLEEISETFHVFAQMVDERIPCLRKVVHNCDCVLKSALNRKAAYEEYAVNEDFFALRNYMFLLTNNKFY